MPQYQQPGVLGFGVPWDLGRGGFVVCRQVPAAEACEVEDRVDGGFEQV
jgi:hypothetical protein